MPLFLTGCQNFYPNRKISEVNFSLTTLNCNPYPFRLLSRWGNKEPMHRPRNTTHQILGIEELIRDNDVTAHCQLDNFGM